MTLRAVLDGTQCQFWRMLSRMYGDWVIMLAAAAIAARLTRFITKDTLAAPLRGDSGFRNEFLSCAWCVGWWISIAVFLAGYVIWPGHDWSAPQLLAWAGAACITNLIHGTIASTNSRIDEITESLELAALRRRS